MFKRKDAVVVPTLDAAIKSLNTTVVDLGAVELNLDSEIKADQAEIERLTQKVETNKYKRTEVQELKASIELALSNVAA